MVHPDLLNFRSLALSVESELRSYRERCCPRCEGVPELVLTHWRGARWIGALQVSATRVLEPVDHRLTPQEERLLLALTSAYPTSLSTAELGQALGGVQLHTARVNVERIRAKVRAFGLNIRNEAGRGYRLVVETS